jgi:hypothetical protein
MLRHAPPSVVHKPEPESRSPKAGPFLPRLGEARRGGGGQLVIIRIRTPSLRTK